MRATAFASRPSESWTSNVEALSSTTLFLVARVGPTVLTIKDELDNTFRVTLGNPHTCTCNSQDDLCLHKLFCLIKVLKVPTTHSLCFQSSLTDNEMDQVLHGLQPEARRPVRSRIVRAIPVVSEEAAAEICVARQPIVDGEENTCTICMDEMTSDQALTWCRVGCGQNMHAKCMIKCAQHNISNKLGITCPLCRNPMDMAVLKADSKGKSSLKNTYAPVQCVNCKCNQREDFYRCVECSQLACTTISGKPYDFCGTCFDRQDSSAHKSHHFVRSDMRTEVAHGVEWIPCKNPATRGVLTNPALVRELQGRELGVNDYELLLQLSDGGPVPEFHNLCIESLPFYTKSRTSKKSVSSTHCWCSSAASPSRALHITVSSPITGEAVLSPLSPSHSNSPLENRAMRMLPCRHVAHDRCLREEIKLLVEDDTGKIVNYRCSHVECGKKIFLGLSRHRRKKPSEIKGDSAKSATSSTPDSQSYGMAGGIIGAGCFGSGVVQSSSAGGLATSLRRNRSVPRGGRSYSTSPAPDMDLGVSGMGSSGGGVSFATGPAVIERVVPVHYQQRQLHAQRLQAQQQLPSLSHSEGLALSGSATGAVRDGPQYAGAGGLLMGQQYSGGGGGGRGGGGASGRRPPAGKRVRLRALGDTSLRGVDSTQEALGVNSTSERRGSDPSMDALNLSNSYRRSNLPVEYAPLGSLSDRSPSPAPLPSISGLQRASSLGVGAGELSRSQQVKNNVQTVLANNVTNAHGAKQRKLREAQAAAVDHNLDLSVMSLSNPGVVMTSGGSALFDGPNNTSQKKPAGRIVRGLRGIVRTNTGPVLDGIEAEPITYSYSRQGTGLSIQTGEELER